MKMSEILSPPVEAKLPKVQKAPAATPKKRRMASVLDAVLETTKALSPAPTRKIAEVAKFQAEAGPSAPTKTKVVAPEDKADQQTSWQSKEEKAKSPTSEAPVEDVDYFFRHASGKKLSKEEVLEAKHYAQKLKYPKGALVFNNIVGVSRPGGSLSRRVNVAACPSPDGSSARASVKGGKRGGRRWA
jgi:ABC-type uncharacterized transport system involved in gliding motility auxiliary subunit